MATSLNDLIETLREAVPARDNVPANYERLVRDAVNDFNRRAPMLKIAPLALTTGIAEYALPGDFLRMIRLSAAGALVEGRVITAEGIIPLSSTLTERWTVSGRKLTFVPAPGFNSTRELTYQAGHSLADGSYPDMEDDVAGIVMRRAEADALMAQANKTAGDAWQYQIGDERVSKERLSAELRAQAQAKEAQYLAAVDVYTGVALSRG